MHIIWLKSDYIDPPDTGGKIRTYNLLRELHRLCTVTYLSIKPAGSQGEGTNETSWASHVVTFPRPEEPKAGLAFYTRVLARMFSTQPFIVQKYDIKDIRDYQHGLLTLLDVLRQEGDQTVVICDFLEMTGNVCWSVPYPKILFQHNVESVIWRRYYENETNWLKKAYFGFEYQRLKRYESMTCNRFDLVLTVSPRDRDVLQKQLGVTVPVEVIETGVDVEFFAPIQKVDPVPGRLLFLGSLDWMPNIDGITWFVRDVYPQVKAASPHVTLEVVGRRPTSAIQDLADADASIHVYGNVPDVRPYMAESDLFIVPLRVGSGTRLKIFEAMAMRRPVVSTTVGAEGLPVHDGRHLMLADSAEGFAETIVSLLADPDRKQWVADEGYELVTRNCAWQNVSNRLYDVCLNVCRQDYTGNVTA